jgi:hypothetical protein
MADGLEHPLHLMRAAFMNGQLDPRVLLGYLDLFHDGRPRLTVLQADALLQETNFLFAQDALDLDEVHLGDMVAGMQQGLAHCAVIRQQHEPLGVEVQTAHGEHPDVHAIQQVLDRRPAFRIAEGRDVSLGFVEDDVRVRFDPPQMPAIDLDMVVVRVDARPQLTNDLAIDRDPPLGDQLLGLSARGEAGRGDDFLKANADFRREAGGEGRLGRLRR